MLPDEYQTLEAEAEAMIEDGGARFFGLVAPADTLEKAAKLADRFFRKHPQAADTFSYFKLGSESGPVGKKGDPAVGQVISDLLSSSELTGVVFAAVREGSEAGASPFAYRDAVVNALRRARVVTRIQYATIRFEVPQSEIAMVTRLITDHRGKPVQTTLGPPTVITVKVRKVQVEDMKKMLTETMKGRVRALEDSA